MSTNTKHHKAKSLMTKVEKILVAIERCSKARDNLRKVVNDALPILESWKEAEHDLESATRSLQDALDKMSEYV